MVFWMPPDFANTPRLPPAPTNGPVPSHYSSFNAAINLEDPCPGCGEMALWKSKVEKDRLYLDIICYNPDCRPLNLLKESTNVRAEAQPTVPGTVVRSIN